MAKNSNGKGGASKGSTGGKSGKRNGPSAKDKASAMRSASRHPDDPLNTSGAAKRIQAAHDRNQPKK
ncbi:hypothetical protein [Nonomuraea sp. SYSU D8015]|uniref:hypothetical protein n=1 Tax=Nonomuraea sp. SYSU D8015 TaxID=2593644 RepID=UPI00166062D5|nr:hypothetical protein [Nonomuraea sp. SYSU D8015]